MSVTGEMMRGEMKSERDVRDTSLTTEGWKVRETISLISDAT